MPTPVLAPASPPEDAVRVDPLPSWGDFDELRASFHALRRCLGEILGPFGLAVTDFSALRIIRRGRSRPTQLSHCLGISPAATTELLDRLETRHLLRRERDPGDRRATRVALTRAGEKLCVEAGDAYQNFLEGVASQLSRRGMTSLRTGSAELLAVLERRARAP